MLFITFLPFIRIQIMESSLAVDIVSICGGLVFVLSLLAQLVKIIKTKSAEDLSMIWLVLCLLAIFAGIFYGTWYNLWPLYIANSLQATVNLALIITKIVLDRLTQKKKLEKNVTENLSTDL